MKLLSKLYRLWYGGFRRNVFRVIDRDGLKYLLNYRNSIDRKMITEGGYEKEQLDYFLNLINKAGCTIFFDVGANIGLYSLNVSSLQSIEKIIAFEPVSSNVCQLSANLLLNNLHNFIEVKMIGLSDEIGEVAFMENTGNSTGRSRIKATDFSANVQSNKKQFKETKIHVDRLDNIIEAVVGNFIAIKIDIEGHELQALHGMRDMLRNNKCILQVESYNPAPIISFLESLGYPLINKIGEDGYYCNFPD
ncbi:MAG: FkbM family methyltransferase [Porticoccus sp.]|jgi:FkbM family methyltransferase|nr:FkbM family methyltransferase [Porticoccus sp.]